MTMTQWEAAAREAERLRILIDVFAHAHPSMTMDEAGPAILAAEKRAAELEAPAMPKQQVFPKLVDLEPETGALFIDLIPEIQEPIRDGKPINGIKEFRGRTGWGLRESKEAVMHWKDTRLGTTTSWAGAGTIPTTSAPTLDAIADWIDGNPSIIKMIDVPHGHPDYRKIDGIKAVRYGHPSHPGLKEAKDGVEHWIRTRGYRAP